MCDHVATYLTRCREDPRYAVDLEYPCATPSEVARTIGLKKFLAGGYDWLLSIDSDNPPGRHVLDLIDYNLPIVGFPTPIYQHVHPPGEETRIMLCYNVYRKRAAGYEPIEPHTCELQEVDAFGTGCYLAARRVFESEVMKTQPYGRVWNEDGTARLGSDLAFCERVTSAGFPVWVHWGYRCNHFITVNAAEVMKIRLDAWNAGLAVGMRKGIDSVKPGIEDDEVVKGGSSASSVLYAGRRSTCWREGQNVKKAFSTGEAGRLSFANERQAEQVFGDYSWFHSRSDNGDNWFVSRRLPEGSRLKDAAPEFPEAKRKDIAGQALSIILDMLIRGYAHRDIHAKNCFIVAGQLKLLDFEYLWRYDEGKRPRLSECYDVTGQGLESPGAAGNMCYSQDSPDSLSTVLGVDFQEAKRQLASILKQELCGASLTFHTSGNKRHTCSQAKTYGSFSLPGLVVNPEDAQRDCAKRHIAFESAEFLPGKTILDLGSNVGGMLFEAQKFKPAGSFGLEYDERKVRVANRVAEFCELDSVDFIQSNVDDLDSHFQYDVVMCLALEAHVNDRQHLYALLGKFTRETLLFEGNATTNLPEVWAELKKNGFSRIENLGVCNDDSREDNNCRPLLRAFK